LRKVFEEYNLAVRDESLFLRRRKIKKEDGEKEGSPVPMPVPIGESSPNHQ
jgi:hypothetical protein